jgi:threonine dehydrogenase-like Zn-dependent dehydrogenase
VATIKELTNGLGAHSVIEAVGTQESMMQAIRSAREGGHVGFVGVAHYVRLPGEEIFFSHVHLHGGPAPVRRFLPDLIDLIWNRTITPWPGLRPRAPTRPGCRGLPGHGRAPSDQSIAAALTPDPSPHRNPNDHVDTR